MKKNLPTVCYIDEEEIDINAFKFEMEGSFTVIAPTINSEIQKEELVNELLAMDIDCLIVDYLLTQNRGIQFKGDELLELFNKKRGGFPQMLLTNHDASAIKVAKGIDIETIHGKYEYRVSKDAFIERINKMISNHKEETQNAKATLEKLSRKIDNHQQLTLKEEEAYLRADNLLDGQLLPDQEKIPETLKKVTISHDDKLLELIKDTEELLSELKKHESI